MRDRCREQKTEQGFRPSRKAVEKGLRDVKIMISIYESARTRKRVKLT